ncbi:hypothetical protein HD806DRAFT_540847 [Xylariaceae sp. AK1471]|nr:hypothetical protein HD806DRAFT_540847 [Xylariaceae sp. AK1471]
MTTTYSEYSLDSEIEAFFKKTSAIQATCDDRAKELAGGDVIPVKVQGACSYTVYAGPSQEYVVQFRLASLALKTEVAALAIEIYGSLAPSVSFEGKLGDGEGYGREPLYVYLMSRVRGVTHLDFILAHGFPENSPDNVFWRKNLIGDVAHFMAVSWNTPQPISSEYQGALRHTYIKELLLLHASLPSRFQSIIQLCIDSIDDIMSLPMVLLHQDFGSCNIIVDEATCHLVGVIDWAEAKVCPFGLNLYALQSLLGKLHLRNGWTLFEDCNTLQALFWERFQQDVGGLSTTQFRSIKLARVLGLLLSYGFTSRLANEPEPVPIGGDEDGRYNMMSLDAFLTNPRTKFNDFEQLRR